MVEQGVVYAIGVEGVESARIANASGYPALFLSGSWVTQVVHNKPDIGFYTAQDAITRSQAILKEFPNAVLIADVDGGFGKQAEATAMQSNIDTAVKAAIELQKIGVAGIVIDDQNPLERKAEVDPGKQVIRSSSMETMIAAIRQAVGPEFVIIGRTAEEQPDLALKRAEGLKKAGSDLIIVEAINDSQQQLREFRSRSKFPLTTIQLDKGEANPWTRENHEKIGINIVLLANALRKRWPEGGAELDTFSAKLGLDLQSCISAH